MDDDGIVRICVYCGSSPGGSGGFAAAAQDVGRLVAAAGAGVVYGGARIGTMGALANAALDGGAEVIGVIPRQLYEHPVVEVPHLGLTRLEIVDDMHARKARMVELCDAILVLPGGLGTLEELFEVWTWAKIGIHDKPLGLLDVDGFYEPMLRFLDGMADAGFVSRGDLERVSVWTEPGKAVTGLVDAVDAKRAGTV